MQYVEYVKLGIAGLTLLVDLIKELKAGNGDSSSVIDRGSDFLSKLGPVAGVKELNAESIDAFKPMIKDLVAKIQELKEISK